MRLPTDEELDREICRRGLHHFVRMSWPIIEPAVPFVDNWHIGAVCEHLQAVTSNQILRLVLNIPPGCMKSLLACVMWPAWEWTQNPSVRWIFASHSLTLSKRDSLKMRRLLESPWYRARWGEVWRPNTDEWGALKYSNNEGGFRMATSVAGGAVGEHAERQGVDD